MTIDRAFEHRFRTFRSDEMALNIIFDVHQNLSSIERTLGTTGAKRRKG